jgi:hypothetical protein
MALSSGIVNLANALDEFFVAVAVAVVLVAYVPPLFRVTALI